MPNTWLQSVTYRNVRQYLSSQYRWLKILHLPDKVFKAIVDTHVIIFQLHEGTVHNDDAVSVEVLRNKLVSPLHQLLLSSISKNGDPINVVAHPDSQTLYKKITEKTEPLSNFCDIYNGVKPFEVGKGTPPQTREVASGHKYVHEGARLDDSWSPLLRGSLIHRYQMRWNNDYWIQYGPWLAAPRDPKIFSAPSKIMVRQTGDSIIATVIGRDFVARNNLHILLPRNKQYNLLYFIGLMNSRLMDYMYTYINPEKGEALAEVKKHHVEQLPICPIDFNNAAEIKMHDQLVKMVENMLASNQRLAAAKTPHESESLQRQIVATDNRIDALVYELYGLDSNEITVVDRVLSRC